jgi:RNA polymerase sigma-70 factor (ECF subfamily)
MSVEHTDDQRLVERLKARDKRAMEILLREHGPKMYGVALRVMRNETDAQEAMQDALISVWEKVGSFEGRSAFSSWLYRVTANAALMRLRKNKKFEQNVPLESPASNTDTPALQLAADSELPDAAILRRELGKRLRTAIDELPEPYRTTVLLSDIDGLSLAEIAEATEASIPAVKSRLHRARLRLREELMPYLKEGV